MTTHALVSQEWLALGNSILETIENISSAEKDAFTVLRDEVRASLR